MTNVAMRENERKTMETQGSVENVENLGAASVEQMLALMKRYFHDVDAQVFETDLLAKDEVILIHADDRIVGFSTVQVSEENINGENIVVLFSGDTIVDVEYWKSPELQRNFIRVATDLMNERDCPVYWFLLCSGYRTYRYLPVFFHEFWPRHDAETPAPVNTLLEELATSRFNGKYRTGVVADLNGRLRNGISPIDDKLLRNAHIAYFQEANPGHERGDELVCLAHITPANLTRAATRVLKSFDQHAAQVRAG